MTPPQTNSQGLVPLEAVHNFRDVAGGGYPLSNGGSMTRGMVYRGSVLTCTEADQQRLLDLGIKRVVDLRSDSEVANQPDLLPAGIDYAAVEVLSDAASSVIMHNAHLHDADSAREQMADTYQSFVCGKREREGFARAVRAVASSPGSTAIHCTAGKDRTGWLAAILQLLAGVSDDEIYHDYLLSTELSSEFVEAVCRYVEEEMPEQLAAMRVFLGVDAYYLERALSVMRTDFGDVRTYLTDGSGLEERVVNGLIARLTSRES